MLRYLLDTDIPSLYQRNHPIVDRNVTAHAADEVAVAIISVEEQISGWYTMVRRATRPDDLARAYDRLAESVKSLATMHILSFTLAAIHRFEQLKRLKLAVRGNDLRIAAIALEHGAVVVTRNTADFQQIPGLSVENWAS